MSYVFVFDGRHYEYGIYLNVHQYVHDYYKLLKKLLYYSHKGDVKVICDEQSLPLFENLSVSTFIMHKRKDITDSCDLDDIMINHLEITEEKENLRFFISKTYPNAWGFISKNLTTRFS